MTTPAWVAVDLGAESGRVIVGTLTPEAASGRPRLGLLEVHRFVHEPLSTDGGLYWNVTHIWDNVLRGLRQAGEMASSRDLRIESVGIDTWGVDYALVDASGQLLSAPRCYRDTRCRRGEAIVKKNIGSARLYEITGIQEMAINTLVQMAAAIDAGDDAIKKAHRFLMMADYLHTLLGGEPRNELSNASTTQLLDARTADWSAELLGAIGIPRRMFGTPCAPGTVLGVLRDDVAQATGLGRDVRIVTPGSHDTASAVAAVPAIEGSWAYLSSGTWSLLGIELEEPILTEQARRAGFTNERGVGGKIRFLKNIIGLWLVQELRRDLEKHGTKLDYVQLTQAAADAIAFRSRINAFHPSLIAPGGAVEKIRALSREAGDPEPTTPGELARCCLEGLAMAYLRVLDELESLAQRRIDVIHIVGGGSRNALLNQMAADATNRRVVVGPAEATAAGNIMVQAMTGGHVANLASIRAVVADSFQTEEYTPADAARWSEQCARTRVSVPPRE